MADLTPETLAEWRADVERFVGTGRSEDKRRILALLDALAAEKARAEEREETVSEAVRKFLERYSR